MNYCMASACEKSFWCEVIIEDEMLKGIYIVDRSMKMKI